MSKNAKNPKPEPDRVYEKKRRSCLMCGSGFTSSWPGERICQSCKSTSAWREAALA